MCVGRRQIFFKDGDYAAFERVLARALARVAGMQLFTYGLMPNHWHLVLRPADDDELSEFMRWLTITHAQRWWAISARPTPATPPMSLAV